MNEPSTQQRLATAIGTVIIPMVETGDGIDDGPLQEFLTLHSERVLNALQEEFDYAQLKEKQP